MMDKDSTSKTDWSKCCLCQQEKSKETLISPLSSFQRKQDYAGHSNIARNVPLFYAINDMPIALDPSRLEEGEGIETTLIRNGAKYHQSCRFCCSTTPSQKEHSKEERSRAPPEQQMNLEARDKNLQTFQKWNVSSVMLFRICKRG